MVGKGIFFALLPLEASYRAIRKVNGQISSPAFAERSNNLSATTAWRSRTEKVLLRDCLGVGRRLPGVVGGELELSRALQLSGFETGAKVLQLRSGQPWTAGSSIRADNAALAGRRSPAAWACVFPLPVTSDDARAWVSTFTSADG